MGLTVNLKPAGFRPIGGAQSLLYKFTEASIAGKPNYRVEIVMNGLSIPTFEFRPDASLVIWCDISVILRAALKIPGTTLAERFNSTYVKYQAVWDGGSDAQVPLNTDVIYFYSGIDHALNHRTKFQISASGGQFLLNTSKLYAWLLRTAYVEFLNDSDLAADSEISYTPSGGAAVQLLAFDGTAKSLQTTGYKFTANGVVRVKKIAAPATVYASINVEILPETCNPIYLKWQNDLGGIAVHLFDDDQLYEALPEEFGRYRNLMVVARGLTFDGWKNLQELNRQGAEYGDNQKSGAYVQDFTTEASPVNVFALPENQSTQTRFYKHNFSIRFRYPIISNIEI